ncbi:hypothetical protein [Thermodesulfobacterium hydrogeniphilum]|uniref:hypothetical protein n=1 Tax=Thermodesulfobacterium hydrogeniphilum TaxID=161156 RepID=UPI00056DF82E|nr:hypothetical protein [Thermodesulfobacterium hydrogeniphilum]
MGDEIRSTLEIALEKAEKIGKASKEELEVLKLQEEAQRLTAKFLREDFPEFEKEIHKLLENKTSQQKKAVLKSIIGVFLKNIVLPYTQYQLDDAKKALEGLKLLFKKIPDISRLCQEIEKLLNEYYLHKETIYNELSKRFSAGIEALEQALSNQMGTEVKINVEEHPQFKEEWNKIKEKLDEEYGKQLEYLKNIFEKIVA